MTALSRRRRVSRAIVCRRMLAHASKRYTEGVMLDAALVEAAAGRNDAESFLREVALSALLALRRFDKRLR